MKMHAFFICIHTHTFCLSNCSFEGRKKFFIRGDILSEGEQEGSGGIDVVPVEGREGRRQRWPADTLSEPSEMFASDDARARGSQRTDVSEDVSRRRWTSDAFLEKRSIHTDGVHEILAGNGESRRGQSV